MQYIDGRMTARGFFRRWINVFQIVGNPCHHADHAALFAVGNGETYRNVRFIGECITV